MSSTYWDLVLAKVERRNGGLRFRLLHGKDSLVVRVRDERMMFAVRVLVDGRGVDGGVSPLARPSLVGLGVVYNA